LAVNADNASVNDKQKTTLASLDNSFEEENSTRCFNHTLQLSGKALLAPFNPALSAKPADLEDLDDDSDLPELISNEDSDDEDDGEDGDSDADGDLESSYDDPKDECDELQALDEQERTDVLATTAIVCETVTKVSHSLPLIHVSLSHSSIFLFLSCASSRLQSSIPRQSLLWPGVLPAKPTSSRSS
jgi:hypothetical protein